MIDVHRCPRCELRFAHVAELRDHFDVDHHVDGQVFEKFHYRSPRHDTPRSACLVVANQTLGDPNLQGEIMRRARNGARIIAVVPATEDAGKLGGTTAEWRMRTLVDVLAAQGIEIEAHLGDPDPMVAVAEAIAHDDIEEILVSTLPPGLSRWLEADLVTRIERRFHKPVHAVSPAAQPS